MIIYLSGEQFISYLLSCDWLKRDRYSLSPIQTCLTFHFVALASLKQSQLLFDRFSTLYIFDSVYYVQYNIMLNFIFYMLHCCYVKNKYFDVQVESTVILVPVFNIYN